VTDYWDDEESGKESGEETAQMDPLCEEMRLRLQHIDPRIDPFLLREQVVKSLLGAKPLSEISKSEQKTLEFRVILEYQHDLAIHIDRYRRRLEKQTDSQAREILLKAKMSEYPDNIEFGEDDEGEAPPMEVKADVPEVDRPIIEAGALAQLHVSAAEGDLEEVKRLIGLGANKNVKDSYGLTPLERAEMMGQTDVSQYLRSL
jgi:hypothetical protein